MTLSWRLGQILHVLIDTNLNDHYSKMHLITHVGSCAIYKQTRSPL